MISRFLTHRSLLLLPIVATLALFAGDAGAQLEFRGVPWGASQDEATERIRAAGYAFRGVDQDGDLVFGAADSVDLVAMFDSAGLVYVEATWLREPDRLPARYRRMGDSMRAAVGAPDTVTADEGEDVYERFMSWNRDGAALELYYRPRGGGLDTALFLRHTGPGWEAEDMRRGEVEEGPRDTTGVGDYHQAFGGFRVLIRVDTVKYERVGPQRYRAYFLHDWMQSRRLPNGLMYSSFYTRVELDCRELRTRQLRVIPLYGGRATPPIDIPERQRQWTRPLPGSPDDVAIRSACEALGRQP
jgi:hypothetical protein